MIYPVIFDNVRNECFAIKLANKVLNPHTSSRAPHRQHSRRAPTLWRYGLNILLAAPASLDIPIHVLRFSGAVKTRRFDPRFQILRREKQNRSLFRKDCQHNPALRGSMPEDFWISKVGFAEIDYGIAGVFFPSFTMIVTVSQTLKPAAEAPFDYDRCRTRSEGRGFRDQIRIHFLCHAQLIPRICSVRHQH